MKDRTQEKNGMANKNMIPKKTDEKTKEKNQRASSVGQTALW